MSDSKRVIDASIFDLTKTPIGNVLEDLYAQFGFENVKYEFNPVYEEYTHQLEENKVMIVVSES